MTFRFHPLKKHRFYKFGRYLFLPVLLTLLVFPFNLTAKDDGQKIYKLCRSSEITAKKIVASDNESIILLSDHNFVSIDSLSLEKNWQFDFKGTLLSEPVFEGSNLTFETIGEKENEADKKKEKETNKTNNIENTNRTKIETVLNIKTGIPVSVNESVNDISATSRPENENANDKRTGQITNNFAAKESINPTDISSSAGNLERIGLGSKKGEVFLVNRTNLTTIWKTKTGGEISNLYLSSKGLLAASNDNFLYLFNYKNANKIWKKRFSGRIRNIFIVGENLAAVTVADTAEVQLVEIEKGKDFGKILGGFSGNITEIKKHSDSDLILLGEKGISLFSSENCAK